jgi:guanylate kinase
MKGKIFVVTGASGSGKTTLAMSVLKDKELNLEKVITCTTREPRSGEINGKDYNFFSREEFEKVYGNYYGSQKKDVDARINSGKNVLFVIDVQGAETLEARDSDVISIFVKSPSISELKIRLEKRGEDSPEKINTRLRIAKAEEEKAPLFDYIIVNDILDDAIDELKRVIRTNIE